MRWSYKTIHFEMKKDGLLGGIFLDESEMEEILNEFGKAGWELISMLDTRDGVIGIFKQPLLEELQTKPYIPKQMQKEPPVAAAVVQPEMDDDEPGLQVYKDEERAEDGIEEDIVDDWETVEEDHVEQDLELEPEPDEDGPGDDDAPDVGSIRIE